MDRLTAHGGDATGRSRVRRNDDRPCAESCPRDGDVQALQPIRVCRGDSARADVVGCRASSHSREKGEQEGRRAADARPLMAIKSKVIADDGLTRVEQIDQDTDFSTATPEELSKWLPMGFEGMVRDVERYWRAHTPVDG